MSVYEMPFDFMPERGTIDAVFILRRMQEECHANGRKLYLCFVDVAKAFDRVPRKVLEWTLSKKEILDVLVRSVMSLYRGVKKMVRVDSELSEEFEVKVGMHQGSVLSPFLFAVVVYVVTELAREGTLSELLCADDLAMMSGTTEGLRNKFLQWKEAFESKCLTVNLGKSRVMVCGGITMDGISKSKVDPCGVCSLRVKANLVLCLLCGNMTFIQCLQCGWHDIFSV